MGSVLVILGVLVSAGAGFVLAYHYYSQALSYGGSSLKDVFWLFLGSFGFLAPPAIVLAVAHATRVRGTTFSVVLSLVVALPFAAVSFGILSPIALAVILVAGAKDVDRSLGRARALRVGAVAFALGALFVASFGWKLERSSSLGRDLAREIERGNFASVEPLLAAGANPNVPGVSGTNAILAAVRSGRLDVVRRVLGRRDVIVGEDQMPFDGDSPIRAAVRSGSAPMVALLVTSATYTPMSAGETEQGPPYDPRTVLGEAERMRRDDLVELLRRPPRGLAP